MPIGDPIVPPIPAVGTSGTSYATKLVNFLTEVKSRLENQVPLTSILVSLLDMANNAISNLQYASFYEQDGTPTEPVGSLQNYAGDLWWVSASGAAQITSGNGLNAADIAGIGGDYGGVNPASARFSDVDETFYFYDDFGALEWARLAARSIDVYGDIDSTTRVRLTAATATTNYTVTFDDALPAAQSLVQIEADGDLVYTNTLAANTSITLSGTGKVKHGTYRIAVPVNRNDVVTASGTAADYRSGSALNAGVRLFAGGLYYIPIHGIDNTKTITSFNVSNVTVSGGNHQYTLVYSNGGVYTSTGITVTSTGASPSASGSWNMLSTTNLFLQVAPASNNIDMDYIYVGFTSA